MQRLRLRMFITLKYIQNINYIGHFIGTASPQVKKHSIYGNNKMKVITVNNKKKSISCSYITLMELLLTFWYIYIQSFSMHMYSIFAIYK